MTYKTAAIAAIAATYLSLSSASAFAQAGGGDVPTDAAKQGEKEQPGSTGRADKGSMGKDGAAMKTEGGSKEKKSDKM